MSANIDLQTASMSHELRTPLNVIIGFAGTLLMRLPGPLNADQEKQLKIIQSSASELLRMIDGGIDKTRRLPTESFALEPTPAIDSPPAPHTPAGKTAGARVLFIEDDSSSGKLFEYLLRIRGFEPMAARDGAQGLAMARLQVPALVFCDLHLPDTGGYEVAREFKRDPVLRDIPLVAMTASVATGKADQVGIIAFDHFLQKPIHPETFAAQVEYFLAAGVVNRFDPPSVAPASGESPLPKLVT